MRNQYIYGIHCILTLPGGMTQKDHSIMNKYVKYVPGDMMRR